MQYDEYIAPYEFSVIDVSGHSVAFKMPAGDEKAPRSGWTMPTRVPTVMVRKVMERGAQRLDGKTEVPARAAANQPPEDPALRVAAITAAVEQLVIENDIDKFGGNGIPKVKAVTDITGWKVMASEIADVWDEVRPRIEAIRNSTGD